MGIVTPNDGVFKSHTQNFDGNARYGVLLVSWNALFNYKTSHPE